MRGLLLVNLGTPDSPQTADVRRYLRQFLMDPDVIDIPWALRVLLVGVILVIRPKKSAEAYQKIWTPRGSPLLFHTQDLTQKVATRAAKTGAFDRVEFAMRYGNPSIESVVQKMLSAGVTELTVIPLYPQYSLAATESSLRAVRRVVGSSVTLKSVQDFYTDRRMIEVFAAETRRVRSEMNADHIIFSFHGLPERQVKRTDRSVPPAAHCLADQSCCERLTEANRDCYRAQSFATARAIAMRMGLAEREYSVAFQSRLGRTPWIQPYTDIILGELPGRGIKRIAVATPSFVADCLETLEEVQIRGREQFVEAGGEDLKLVPSLNSSDEWASAVLEIASEANLDVPRGG